MTTVPQSTNRDRLDRFYTPAWATRVLLDRWQAAGVIDERTTIIDPCCGDGAICDVASGRGYDVRAGDIRPHHDAVARYDARSVDVRRESAQTVYSPPEGSVIATNPPYNADTGTAGEVLTALMRWGLPVVALLNTRFLEPCRDRRHLLHGEWQPTRIIYMGRVEYDRAGGGEDNTPILSAWLTWEPGAERQPVQWVTPVEKRRAMGQADLVDLMEAS